jgi:hypothetical protein
VDGGAWLASRLPRIRENSVPFRKQIPNHRVRDSPSSFTSIDELTIYVRLTLGKGVLIGIRCTFDVLAATAP